MQLKRKKVQLVLYWSDALPGLVCIWIILCVAYFLLKYNYGMFCASVKVMVPGRVFISKTNGNE